MLMIIIINISNVSKFIIFSNEAIRQEIMKELNHEPCVLTIQRESHAVEDELLNNKTCQFYKLE